jgi:hypothetical protein
MAAICKYPRRGATRIFHEFILNEEKISKWSNLICYQELEIFFFEFTRI